MSTNKNKYFLVVSLFHWLSARHVSSFYSTCPREVHDLYSKRMKATFAVEELTSIIYGKEANERRANFHVLPKNL